MLLWSRSWLVFLQDYVDRAVDERTAVHVTGRFDVASQANANAALYFVDRHLVEERGDKVAFREADGEKRSLTYGELADQSGAFCGRP